MVLEAFERAVTSKRISLFMDIDDTKYWIDKKRAKMKTIEGELLQVKQLEPHAGQTTLALLHARKKQLLLDLDELLGECAKLEKNLAAMAEKQNALQTQQPN